MVKTTKATQKTETKTPIYKKWWFWGIILFLILCVGAGSSSNKQATSPEPENNTEASTSTLTEDDNKVSTMFEESEMEAYCQEDHVNDILGYFNGHKISIVKVLGYNKYFSPTDGGKTKDGQDIAMLQWHGVDKTTGKDIGFSCWATKLSDGTKKLLYLGADGNAIRGSLDADW